VNGCKQSGGCGQGEGVPEACLGLQLVNAFLSAVLLIIRAYYELAKIRSESVNPVNNMSLEILLLAAEYVDRRGKQYHRVRSCTHCKCELTGLVEYWNRNLFLIGLRYYNDVSITGNVLNCLRSRL